MTMRIYKPGKKELIDAAVVAVLLIALSYAKSFIAPLVEPYLGQLGEFAGLVVAAIVGFVVGAVLMLIGFGRYAAMAFALAVGVELAKLIGNVVNV